MGNDRMVEELRSRSPGADPEDPYEDVDVGTLPAWWQRAIEEFRAHDLRPYRPPRFEDGNFIHDTVVPLEHEYDVGISFASVDTDYRERWTVRVDGESVGTVGRHRSPDGYTVYEIESDEFESLVRDALDEG